MAITQEQTDKIVAANRLREVAAFLDAKIEHKRITHSNGKKERQVVITWDEGDDSKEVAEALFVHK